MDLLVNLGFRLNMEKSVLIPTQRVIYLSMVIDSLTMTFSLPEKKVSAIVQKATILKSKNRVSVREIYQFIGMCSATRLAVKEAPMFTLTTSTPSDNLTERKFTFKIPMLLNEIHASPPCPARSGLVDTQSFHLNFKPNYTSSSRHLRSDRHFRPGVGRLPETPKDFGNVDKEPTFLAHKQKGINGNFSQSKVFPKIPGECPCSNNDRQLNKCVRMEGTKSVTLSNLALEIWRWCLRKAIHISAVHVAGLLNIFADPLSRFQLLSTEWMLCKRIFRQIMAVYGCPQIDLFASSQNHQLKTYCSWIEGQMQGNTNSLSVEIKTLVSNYFRDPNGSPSSSPNQKGSLATSPIKSNSSSPDRQKKRTSN